jgi:hypothetical protein
VALFFSLGSMKTLAYIIAIVFAFTGCAGDMARGFRTPDLREAIARNDTIVLSKFTDFAWDKVYIFAPYTPEDIIKSEIGESIPFPHSEDEGHCLLAFSEKGKVVAWLEVQRSDADFADLHRVGGYSPQEAVFLVKKTADGWKKLVLPNQSPEPNAGGAGHSTVAVNVASRRGLSFPW